MEGVIKEAFGAAGPYPLVQMALLFITVVGGIYFMSRGSKDNSNSRDSFPQWLLISPAHDLIDDVSEIAELMRRQTAILEKIDVSLMACKVTLELIRDESKLR